MDLGLTTSTTQRNWLHYLPAGFMVLFLIAGLGMSVLSPSLLKSPENKRLLNGEWASAYEAEFNKSLAIRQPAIDTWGVLEYALFRNGRDGVLIGEDGWLFTSEEFKQNPERDEAVEEKLELATRAKEILAKQGSSLVVVLIPAKARIYQEHLGRYALPSYNRDVYENFVASLQGLEIPVVSLQEPLSAAKQNQDVFLKTDTHWTPYGAEVVAKTIAEVVAKQQLLPSLNSATFTTTQKETLTPHQGDLLNYLPLGNLQTSLGPVFDELSERTTEGEASGGLFGSSSIPVALVGTSYSANPLWNFEGALKEALGADVLNVANQGEGPVVPMLEYLDSQALKDTPPELVLWEIPERFLTVKYGLQ